MNIKISVVTVCFFSFFSISKVFSQKDTIGKQSVTIVSAYKPVLMNVSKINFSASNLNLTGAAKDKLSYNIPDQPLVYSYSPITIKPLAYEEDSINNDGYHSIKQTQVSMFKAKEKGYCGADSNSGISFPSFKKLANIFNFNFNKITNLNELELALKQDLNTTQAVLFEIIMNPDQKYLPRLSTSKLKDGTLVSPPLEDLDPLIPIEVLRDVLEFEPHINSYRSRKQ
jgi:hypothetical protein